MMTIISKSECCSVVAHVVTLLIYIWCSSVEARDITGYDGLLFDMSPEQVLGTLHDRGVSLLNGGQKDDGKFISFVYPIGDANGVGFANFTDSRLKEVGIIYFSKSSQDDSAFLSGCDNVLYKLKDMISSQYGNKYSNFTRMCRKEQSNIFLWDSEGRVLMISEIVSNDRCAVHLQAFRDAADFNDLIKCWPTSKGNQ